MFGRFPGLMLVATALLLAAGSARAAEVTEIRKLAASSWTGHAYAFSDSGTFSHCSISLQHLHGGSLTFTLHSGYQFRIEVSHPAWSFREGQAVSAELQVDDGASFSGKGVAFSQVRAAFGIDGTAANYQLFRSGRRLHVRLSGQTYDFFLEGSAKALSTLVNCVDTYTTVAQAPADAAAEKQSGAGQPPKAQPKNKQSEVASSAPAQAETSASSSNADRTAQRLEATEIATNIAADAGLQGFRVVNDPEQRKKVGNPDVLWVAGSLIGSANIIDDVPDLSIDEVAAVRAAQVTGCDREKSTAAKRENLDGVATVSTLIRCVDANDKPIVIDNTLIERRAGVFFGFELIYANADGSGTGSQESAAGVGAQVRDAVLTVLKPQ